jgi:hypothetical protein
LKVAASRGRTLLDQQEGAATDETTDGIAAERASQGQDILTIVRSQCPALPFFVHQDGLRGYGLHSYRCGHRRAIPKHGGRPLSSIYGNLVNLPPSDQAGLAVAGEVGGHHLVGVKGRTEAAIGSDQAVGLRVGVDVARLVNHLVNSDALDPGRQTQSVGLDDVRCLLIQTDHEAGIMHRTGWVVRRRSVGLVDPDGLAQAMLLHRLAEEAGDLVDRLGLEVDV